MELIRIEIVLSALVAISAFASVLLTVISLRMQRNFHLKTAKPVPQILSAVRNDMTRIGVINKGPGTMIITSRKYFFNDEEFDSFNKLWKKHFAINHPDGVHKGCRLTRQTIPKSLISGGSANIISLTPTTMDDLDAYLERRLLLLEGLSQFRIEYTYTDVYDTKFPPAAVDNKGFFKRKALEQAAQVSANGHLSEADNSEQELVQNFNKQP